MSTADLYTEDFPHGSASGFDRGCRSNAMCPNNGDPIWFTCKEAKELKRSDYAYRSHPDGDPMPRNPEDLQPPAAPEQLEPLEARPGFTTQQIREWAKSHGIDAGTRGAVKNSARQAYQDALAASRPPKPTPPTTPLTVTPLSPEAEEATKQMATEEVSPDTEQIALALEEARNTITNLRTALAAEQEAHALTRKQSDDQVARSRREITELEHALATEREAHAEELRELKRVVQQNVDDLKITSLITPTDVVAAVTGGGSPPATVMRIGDVHLELPAGTAAQLHVASDAVHVQIGG